MKYKPYNTLGTYIWYVLHYNFKEMQQVNITIDCKMLLIRRKDIGFYQLAMINFVTETGIGQLMVCAKSSFSV